MRGNNWEGQKNTSASGHAQISTTLHYYANADTEMKKKAIEKATSKLNPLVSDDNASLEWENDEDMIRRLYGLSN